jgi:hypothetical protein
LTTGGLLISTSGFGRREQNVIVPGGKDQGEFSDGCVEMLETWRMNLDALARRRLLPASYDRRFCDLLGLDLRHCATDFRGNAITPAGKGWAPGRQLIRQLLSRR